MSMPLRANSIAEVWHTSVVPNGIPKRWASSSPKRSMLHDMVSWLSTEGNISMALIQNTLDVPSPASYARRFGTMQYAYEMIGYGRSAQFGALDVGFFFQAEDGIRDSSVTGVQTCALPISELSVLVWASSSMFALTTSL